MGRPCGAGGKTDDLPLEWLTGGLVLAVLGLALRHAGKEKRAAKKAKKA